MLTGDGAGHAAQAGQEQKAPGKGGGQQLQRIAHCRQALPRSGDAPTMGCAGARQQQQRQHRCSGSRQRCATAWRMRPSPSPASARMSDPSTGQACSRLPERRAPAWQKAKSVPPSMPDRSRIRKLNTAAVDEADAWPRPTPCSMACADRRT